MPRDLEAELARRRAATDSLFADRPAQIDANIDKTRSDISGGRDQFFSGTLSPYLDRFGSAGAAAKSTYQGRLGRELNRTLASRKRRETMTSVDQAYQTALRRATDAGANEQDAISYARQFASDEQRRQFEAQQATLDRESALRKGNIADEFSNKGLGVSAGSTGVDYESAIIRALFGLGTSAGAGYLLNKKANTPTDPYTSAPVASQVPYGPQNQNLGMYPLNPYSTGGR